MNHGFYFLQKLIFCIGRLVNPTVGARVYIVGEFILLGLVCENNAVMNLRRSKFTLIEGNARCLYSPGISLLFCRTGVVPDF
jgi:hypothetical protein